MLTVPEATPVTTPDELPTVAREVFPLAQYPPLVASFRVMVEPMHTDEDPVIVEGEGLTVTTILTAPQLVV
jgi:hypothetical protein